MPLEDLKDFGKLWIASSDLTSHETHISTFLNNGADAVVLKTAIENPGKGGINRRKYFTGKTRIPDVYTDGIIAYSEGGDSKTLSLEQSNFIYENLKSKFPDKKIIQSLGITCEDDFSLIGKLKGDAVELNLRYNNKKPKTPYYTTLGTIDIINNDETRKMNALKKEIYEMTGNFIEGYNGNRPIILKLGDPLFETNPDDYLKLKFSGFTLFDSDLIVDKITFEVLKGKKCGEPLFLRSFYATMGLGMRFPDVYKSISGGIMTPKNADKILSMKPGSVQICSAFYKDKRSNAVIMREFADIVQKYK